MKVIKGDGYKIEWHGEEFLIEMDNLFKKQVEERAAKNIEHNAKNLCPVGNKIITSSGDTWKSRVPGTLKRSIKSLKSKFKDGGWIVMAGSSDAFYARFVELGTKFMSAKPYLRSAKHIEEHRIKSYLTNARKKSRYLKTR